MGVKKFMFISSSAVYPEVENLIKEDMVKNDAVIVDFGFEKLGNRVAGDVDFNLVASKSSLITPVPGGMGPIVIATFLKNAVEISQNHLLKS